MTRRYPAVLAACLLTLGGCSTDSSRDSSAWVACRDYVRLVTDVGAGIVSVAELRPRLQAIDRNAQLSLDPAVKENARALLRAATTGEGLPESAASALTAACRQHR